MNSIFKKIKGQDRAPQASHHRRAFGNIKEGKCYNINHKHVLTTS
jgi:hypothetical protein